MVAYYWPMPTAEAKMGLTHTLAKSAVSDIYGKWWVSDRGLTDIRSEFLGKKARGVGPEPGYTEYCDWVLMCPYHPMMHAKGVWGAPDESGLRIWKSFEDVPSHLVNVAQPVECLDIGHVNESTWTDLTCIPAHA